MTGIRLWTSEVTALGIVVRIEQDLIHCPLGSFQRSHRPANANNSALLTSKQNGSFGDADELRERAELGRCCIAVSSPHLQRHQNTRQRVVFDAIVGIVRTGSIHYLRTSRIVGNPTMTAVVFMKGPLS